MANIPDAKTPKLPAAEPEERHSDHFLAGRIAFAYAVVGILWIVVSDRLVNRLFADPQLAERVQTWKGLGFIVVTALGLHWLSHRSLRRGRMSEENRRFFAHLANNTGEAILVVDPADDFRFVYLNPAALLLADRAPDEILGRPVWELKPDCSREKCARGWSRLQAGELSSLEIVLQRADGTPFPAELTLETLVTSRHQFLSGRVRDISQRRADADRLTAQARFRQELIDSVPLPVFVKDPAGRYLECNRALTEFLGRGREELIGKTVADVFPEDRAGEYRRRDTELFQSRGRQVYRGQVRNAAGQDRTVIFHRATFLDAQGHLGGLIGTFIDVTDSDLAMDRLRLQESALRAAANGIVITDHEGKIQWANPAFERLTGYSVEESLNQTLKALKAGQQDAAFHEQVWSAIRAGQVWQGELINRRRDGSRYHEEMTITPLKDEQGRITHFIAIKQDISARKEIELQYLRAQRMEGIGLLASGIAHDLNNVLAPVLLSIELLQAMHPDTETQEILQTVEQSARRGADIVRQVLTFARGVKGERIPLQPKHLVKDIIRVAKETFPKNIEVHIRLDTEVANVEGDPTQIHQVLLNLAVNARDAMPDGGRLTLAASNRQVREPLPAVNGPLPAGNYVVLSVKDTGLGLDPAVVSQIFEPFYTTKAANKGTGLGLPTALGIVKSHNGYFRVLSELGKGAEFLVYLPVCDRDEANRPGPALAAPRGNGETVLVVDDEPGIRSIASEIISRHGYRVLIASDGTDAMALVAQHRGKVELVVTDVMMPHMDGVALVRSLRKLAPHTRVLAFSGLSEDPTLAAKVEELRRLGLPPVLAKPLTAPVLLTAIHELLNSSPDI